MTLVADFNVSVSVPFQRMRMLLFEQGGGIQEGVVGATDLKVAQRGAGANMSVDVPAGAAWVQIDTGTRNGLGHVYNDATANVTVTASNATNPRIDQIILRWNETSIPTGAGNVPTLEVLTGTATAGATLDNRVGATALPNDCLRLADILVPTSSTSVTTANIRDRRPWARGAYFRVARTAGSYTTTSLTQVEIDATNLKPRIECTGNAIEFVLTGIAAHSAAATAVSWGLFMDGAAIDSTVSIGASVHPTASSAAGALMRYVAVPPAGTHTFSPTFAGLAAGTVTLFGTAANPNIFTAQEIVRPITSNT